MTETRVTAEGDSEKRPETCHVETTGECPNFKPMAQGIGEGYAFNLHRCFVCNRMAEELTAGQFP